AVRLETPSTTTGAALGDLDPGQVLGEDDVAGEVRGGLLDEVRVLVGVVALGDVGEHEAADAGLGRDPAGLARGEVPVGPGQGGVGVQVGGLDDEQVGAVGEAEGVVAQPGDRKSTRLNSSHVKISY